MSEFDLDRAGIPRETLALVPRDVALTFKVVPIRLTDGVLECAVPFGATIKGDEPALQFMLNRLVALIEFPEDQVSRALERFYSDEGRGT